MYWRRLSLTRSATGQHRLGLVLLGYLAAVFLSGALFTALQRSAAYGTWPHRFTFVFGPGLALCTHMSYLLLTIQTLMMLPALWAFGQSRLRKLGATALVGGWLILGWRMAPLF